MSGRQRKNAIPTQYCRTGMQKPLFQTFLDGIMRAGKGTQKSKNHGELPD
jgi:hypothetical protein